MKSMKLFSALILVVLGWGRGAVAMQDDQVRRALSANLTSWLKNEQNWAAYRGAIPPEISVAQGVLEFPESWTPVWVFRVPNVSLGARKAPAREALASMLKAYLMAGGGQALESIAPEAEQKRRLQELIAKARVRIEDQREDGGERRPTLASAQYVVSWPQCGVVGTGGWVVTSPILPELGPITPQTAELHFNRGYELYWSGDRLGARREFRAVTGTQPDNALAWYYQALAERDVGDWTAADGSLRSASASEARMGTSREVSLALVRVQGPVRLWIEESRRQAKAGSRPT
jgi:hypothetical protein